MPRSNDRTATKLSAAEKENEELKRQLAELLKEQHASGKGKRKREDDGEEECIPHTVNFNEGLDNIIEKKVKDTVWPIMQFIANEDQENEAMELILQKTQEWSRLEALSVKDRKSQIKVRSVSAFMEAESLAR